MDPTALAKYLKSRIDYLSAFNAHITNHLAGEKRIVFDNTDDDEAIAECIHHFDVRIGQTFRYSAFIALCAYLEESLALILTNTMSDYKRRFRKLEGNWIVRDQQLLQSDSDIDFSAVKDQWRIMELFVPIRNCITHSWGNLTECSARDHERVIKIIESPEWRDEKKIKDKDALIKDKGTIYFQRTKDDFVWVTEDAVPAGIVASHRILRHLFRHLFDVDIGW